jgi:hypothetical protein
MSNSIQANDIMSTGMKVLRETLGVIEAEMFIAAISSNKADYTEWREDLWEDITLHELLLRAANAEDKHGVPEGIEIV